MNKSHELSERLQRWRKKLEERCARCGQDDYEDPYRD